MDSEILFWLALLAVYLLQAVFSKKKKPVSPIPGSGNPALPHGSGEPELDDALSEISKLLRKVNHTEATPSQNYPPLPHEVEAMEIQGPVPDIPTRSRTSDINTGQAFFDESFEQIGLETFNKPVITHDHGPDVKQVPKESTEVSHLSTLSGLVYKDTHNQNRLKEAIILSEVLGPPKGRR